MEGSERQARIEFCQKILDADYAMLKGLIMTDEKIFTLDGCLNKGVYLVDFLKPILFFSPSLHFFHNFVPLKAFFFSGNHFDRAPKGSGGNPTFQVGISSHSSQLMTWGACLFDGAIYLDVLPRGIAVNSKVYHGILVRFVKWLSQHLKVPVAKLRGKKLTFQQDDTSCHATLLNMRYICSKFPNVISKLPEKTRQALAEDLETVQIINWPPRSPDLTVPDFWMWGALSEFIYSHPVPSTVNELKEKLLEAPSAIPRDQALRSMDSLRSRAQRVLYKDGRHLK